MPTIGRPDAGDLGWGPLWVDRAAATVLRPIGDFNTARIVVRASHVEQWLNAVVVACALPSAALAALVAHSTFRRCPALALRPAALSRSSIMATGVVPPPLSAPLPDVCAGGVRPRGHGHVGRARGVGEDKP